MAGQTVIVSVLADTRRFNTAMAGTDRALRRFEDSLRNVNRIGLAAFTTITYAVGRFAVSSVKAAEEVEAIDRKLQNTAERMGLFGDQTKYVVDRMKDLARRTEAQIAVDAELIKSVQTILLTFDKVAVSADDAGEAFDRTTLLAFDLAEVLNTDAAGAAVQLGKALQDPIAGLSALRRSGVSFDPVQRQQIENLVAQNKLYEAQDLILKELERQFGGSASAGATASARLSLAFDNLQETFGKKILTKLTPAIEELTTALDDLASSKEFEEFANALAEAFKQLVEDGSLKELVKQLGDLLGWMNENKITLVDLAYGFLVTSGAISVVSASIGPLIGWLGGLAKGAKDTRKEFYTNADALDDFVKKEEYFIDVAEDVQRDLDDLETKYKEGKFSAKQYAVEKKRLNEQLKIADKNARSADKAYKNLATRIREGKISVADLYKENGKLAGSFSKLGSGIGSTVKAGGKLLGWIGIVLSAIEIIRGVIDGFGKQWQALTEQFGVSSEEQAEKLDKVFKVLGFIDTILRGIGEFVGTVLATALYGILEVFNFIYDVVEAIWNFFASPEWGQGTGTTTNYGTVTPPTYTPYSAPTVNRPSTAPIYNVSVSALTPTPEVGRVVVKAIQDYERTGGVRVMG